MRSESTSPRKSKTGNNQREQSHQNSTARSCLKPFENTSRPDLQQRCSRSTSPPQQQPGARPEVFTRSEVEKMQIPCVCQLVYVFKACVHRSDLQQPSASAAAAVPPRGTEPSPTEKIHINMSCKLACKTRTCNDGSTAMSPSSVTESW